MKKIISLLVGIIYVFGTSSMFHVFAMDHIYLHTEHTHNIRTIGVHHATPHYIAVASLSCGEGDGGMQVCGLIESSKTSIIPSNLTLSSIVYYTYIPLSVFLPPIKIIEIDKPYENFTIHKPNFSLMIVGIIKLTI